jgi:hypothetical protein
VGTCFSFTFFFILMLIFVGYVHVFAERLNMLLVLDLVQASNSLGVVDSVCCVVLLCDAMSSMAEIDPCVRQYALGGASASISPLLRLLCGLLRPPAACH